MFDFMLSLSALALLFTMLVSLIYTHNFSSGKNVEFLSFERDCEIISAKLEFLSSAGDGAIDFFHTRGPISLDGGREAVFGESYVCVLPKPYTVGESISYADGELKLENKNGKLVISR